MEQLAAQVLLELGYVVLSTARDRPSASAALVKECSSATRMKLRMRSSWSMAGQIVSQR